MNFQSVWDGLVVSKLATVFMGVSEPPFIRASSSDFAEASRRLSTELLNSL